jgi:hypothetical protein
MTAAGLGGTTMTYHMPLTVGALLLALAVLALHHLEL